MKFMKSITAFAAAALIMASCTMSYPGIATGNVAEKEGSIERKVWFGIAIKPVNLSIEKAAENGGITKVATVDYSVRRGLFKTTYKVMVTGN